MSGPPKYLREESPSVDVAQRQVLMLGPTLYKRYECEVAGLVKCLLLKLNYFSLSFSYKATHFQTNPRITFDKRQTASIILFF